jgi:hypothetical protein
MPTDQEQCSPAVRSRALAATTSRSAPNVVERGSEILAPIVGAETPEDG